MSTTPVLHQPTMPQALTEDQWAGLERTANRLAQVSWIPEVYRKKPNDIMAAGLALLTIGRDLTPMTLKLVYVVKGTVDFMVDLIVAQVHEHGHEIWVVESDETHATVAGQRRGSTRVHTRTFTIDDARRAGLVGKDVWKQYVEDMLIARAAKRVAKRVCPEALLSLPPPMNYVITDSGRVQLADIVRELDPDDDEVYDGEVVGEGPPAHLDVETGEIGHATVAPPGPAAADDQDEVYANRRRRANAVMGEVDVKSDDARHALVLEATGGATQSTGRLTAWQVEAIVDFCRRLKADDQAPGEVGDNGDGAVVEPSTAPPPPGPADWPALAAKYGVSVPGILRKAREFAGARGLALPASIDEVTDEQVVSDVCDWLGEA